MRGENSRYSLSVIRYSALILTVVLVAGCSGGGSADERDERDPYLRKARDAKSGQDFDTAISWYNKALDRKPQLARAHLELGLLYDQQLDDDIRAIYHYQRYLELRPNAEKKEIIQELIGHAKISFAASLSDNSNEAIREIQMLKKEVQTLRVLLADAQAAAASAPKKSKASAAKAAKAAAEAVETPAVAATPEAAPAASETYVVQGGDTLSRIATRVYNDPNKWREIYDANRDALASPQSIKVGQTLVIPR